ncbi:hypothetical protein DFH29DRAFT_884027 [Suillus ampliporus]|nr:hypothetical protein DFH29DRAFT_884027 [Suillus ampliporus]
MTGMGDPSPEKSCKVSGSASHGALTLACLLLTSSKDDFTRVIRHAADIDPTGSRTDLMILFRVIWDEVMLPIINVLQHDLKLQRRSLIWLCPTAAFMSVPLHAARPFRMKADRSGWEPCLEDLYICSYTPTLLALIRARQIMKTCATLLFAAIVQGQPGEGQGTVLAAVDSEFELVHTLVPPNVKFTHLSGDQATQAAMLRKLNSHSYPYHTICHTAVGDEKMPDELIHLAFDLQFSGFKSVTGTLWVVDNDVAKHVVEAFYDDMFKGLKEGAIDCAKAVSALNKAMYAVNNKVLLKQSIVFIHIGSSILLHPSALQVVIGSTLMSGSCPQTPTYQVLDAEETPV